MLVPLWGSAQFIDDNIEQKDLSTKRFVLKTDPTLFLQGPIPGTGEYRVSSELAIGSKSSIQLGGSFVGKDLISLLSGVLSDSSNVKAYRLTGYRFQFTYKYYPFGHYKNAPEGFFVGPHFSISQVYFHIKNTALKYSNYTITYANAALIFGYQFAIGDTFVIELFQGLGYRDNRLMNDYTGKEEKLNYDPEVTPIPGDLKIYFGANFGFMF